MEQGYTIIGIIVSITGLFGYSLKLLLPYFLKKIDQKDKRLDEVTDKFSTVVTNHLEHSKQQNERMIDMLDRTGKSVDTNTELTRRVLEKL